MFDLRSDTVTRPSAAMRRAMAEAEVGDDVYREDPTVRRLEERVAALLGKEAALFVPSGTMANQIALLCHSQRGDEAIAGEGSHCIWYESGAAQAWSGISFKEVGQGGLFTAADLAAAIKPQAYWCPRTTLVVVENTHNRGGGRVFPQEEVLAIAKCARTAGLSLHLDGARIWNAAAATGREPAELAAPFDTASACFSKGLGAPIGSAISGSRATIERALRFRKMLGGAMRQVGVLAAAALHALDHLRERLADDHVAARTLAGALAELPGVAVVAPETNIVLVDLPFDAERAVEAGRRHGVLFSAFGPRRLRLVTHLDVSGAGFDQAVTAVVRALREVAGA